MKAILTNTDYQLTASDVAKTINKRAMLPANVFDSRLRFFLFIEFHLLFAREFFNGLKLYLANSSEHAFFVTALDPDPVAYFGAHFNFFGTIEFSRLDSEDVYVEGLIDIPEKRSPDSLRINSNLLVLSSRACDWAIYGDRGYEIAICAFSTQEQMNTFKKNLDELLISINCATDIAFSATEDYVSQAEFLRNYG